MFFTNVLRFTLNTATLRMEQLPTGGTGHTGEKSKRTRKWEPKAFPRRQHDNEVSLERTKTMIKRAKNTQSKSARSASRQPAMSRADRAALNERPVELNTAPHDPDSETAWMADGNCRLHPPATFFPSDGVGVDRARKICKDCPVVSMCLEYALDARIDHGVWGGCSERERRRILKRRREDAVVGTGGLSITAASTSTDDHITV